MCRHYTFPPMSCNENGIDLWNRKIYFDLSASFFHNITSIYLNTFLSVTLIQRLFAALNVRNLVKPDR